MSTLDIIILVCLGTSLLIGVWKGLVAQLFAVAALLVSAWASMKFSVTCSEWLGTLLTDIQPVVLKTFSFLIIFICTAVLTGLAGRLMEKCIKIAMLGWANRLFGALLALGCCLLVLGLGSILFDTLYAHYAQINDITEAPGFIRDSMLYEPIHRLGTWIFPYLSKLSV